MFALELKCYMKKWVVVLLAENLDQKFDRGPILAESADVA